VKGAPQFSDTADQGIVGHECPGPYFAKNFVLGNDAPLPRREAQQHFHRLRGYVAGAAVITDHAVRPGLD
jgi:hypothetical protein